MLGQGHFLSKTGQCKVWDSGADGYCRADGVGSVVIKRLDDALADNDEILACIAAGATNHSAESISITQPHAAAQKENYRQVMNKAGVSPLEVSFVELHGTGTQVFFFSKICQSNISLKFARLGTLSNLSLYLTSSHL